MDADDIFRMFFGMFSFQFISISFNSISTYFCPFSSEIYFPNHGVGMNGIPVNGNARVFSFGGPGFGVPGFFQQRNQRNAPVRGVDEWIFDCSLELFLNH